MQVVTSDRNDRRRIQRRAQEEAIIIGPTGVVWHRVEQAGGSIREPVKQHRGRDVMWDVDPHTHRYRMVCACGRVRYARPNTIHEVTKCRICQNTQRRKQRQQQRE